MLKKYVRILKQQRYPKWKLTERIHMLSKLLQQLKKYSFILLGSLCLILGTIGIFFPVLPTTPFLLLTAFFYLRSSKKLYHALLNHKVFGPYIYNYITYKAIPKKTKIIALLMLWASIICSIFFIDKLFVGIMLTIIASLVSIHILSLKTLTVNS